MTKQAENSLSLYRGENPMTIRRALEIQKKKVVEELMRYFGAADLDELSIRLSIGIKNGK